MRRLEHGRQDGAMQHRPEVSLTVNYLEAEATSPVSFGSSTLT